MDYWDVRGTDMYSLCWRNDTGGHPPNTSSSALPFSSLALSHHSGSYDCNLMPLFKISAYATEGGPANVLPIALGKAGPAYAWASEGGKPPGLWNLIFCYQRFSRKNIFLSFGVDKIKFHRCCSPWKKSFRRQWEYGALVIMIKLNMWSYYSF